MSSQISATWTHCETTNPPSSALSWSKQPSTLTKHAIPGLDSANRLFASPKNWNDRIGPSGSEAAREVVFAHSFDLAKNLRNTPPYHILRTLEDTILNQTVRRTNAPDAALRYRLAQTTSSPFCAALQLKLTQFPIQIENVVCMVLGRIVLFDGAKHLNSRRYTQHTLAPLISRFLSTHYAANTMPTPIPVIAHDPLYTTAD